MKRRLSARPFRGRLDHPIPLHWFRGDPFRSHWFNTYSLVVPDGEKFIRRTVERFARRIESDPALARDLAGFLAQETSHAVQHTRSHALLDRLGLRYRAFASANRFLNFTLLEPRMRPRLLLAVAAGVEHFNAMFGELGLSDPNYLDGVDPIMSELLRWHFAEEIEHKSFVHDVYRRVAPDSEALRVAGGLVGFAMTVVDLIAGTLWFAAQDGSLRRPATYASAYAYFFRDERFAARMLEYARAYVRPDFHPNQRENDALVERVFGPSPRLVRAV